MKFLSEGAQSSKRQMCTQRNSCVTLLCSVREQLLPSRQGLGCGAGIPRYFSAPWTSLSYSTWAMLRCRTKLTVLNSTVFNLFQQKAHAAGKGSLSPAIPPLYSSATTASDLPTKTECWFPHLCRQLDQSPVRRYCISQSFHLLLLCSVDKFQGFEWDKKIVGVNQVLVHRVMGRSHHDGSFFRKAWRMRPAEYDA